MSGKASGSVTLTLVIVGILIIGSVVALFVMKGYRSKTSPNLSKDVAIDLVKQQYPELKDYPSDHLPPKSIQAEKDQDNWYVAFVQNGSGLPILSARCFRVDTGAYAEETGHYTPPSSSISSNASFSPRSCSKQGE